MGKLSTKLGTQREKGHINKNFLEEPLDETEIS
jgi:hypothetical protein